MLTDNRYIDNRHVDNRPIGIFDSGIGGFTVLSQLRKALPTESFIYVADNANKPFGDKTKQQILRINDSIITYLLSQQVKLIVIACNTSSAIALSHDKSLYPVPFVDMLLDGLWFSALLGTKTKVGVIATKATVASNAYPKTLLHYNPHLIVSQQACPKLVPLIEKYSCLDKGSVSSAPELDEVLREYTKSFMDHNVLILGCSHYPHIQKEIETLLPTTRVIDPAEFVTKRVKEHIEIMGQSSVLPTSKFYYTADEPTLKANAKRLGFESFDKILLP